MQPITHYTEVVVITEIQNPGLGLGRIHRLLEEKENYGSLLLYVPDNWMRKGRIGV